MWKICIPTMWRHNGRDGVSNYQPRDCLLRRLFIRRSKKTSKLRVTGLCEGNSPVAGKFLAQRASNAENVFIGWRHHGFVPAMTAELPRHVQNCDENPNNRTFDLNCDRYHGKLPFKIEFLKTFMHLPGNNKLNGSLFHCWLHVRNISVDLTLFNTYFNLIIIAGTFGD